MVEITVLQRTWFEDMPPAVKFKYRLDARPARTDLEEPAVQVVTVAQQVRRQGAGRYSRRPIRSKAILS